MPDKNMTWEQLKYKLADVRSSPMDENTDDESFGVEVGAEHEMRYIVLYKSGLITVIADGEKETRIHHDRTPFQMHQIITALTEKE